MGIMEGIGRKRLRSNLSVAVVPYKSFEGVAPPDLCAVETTQIKIGSTRTIGCLCP